ncbi:hypothetical protein LTR49_014162 [Elasticomyces elasticus]|nr:hypothetical protein LTR49_014162 [Elasticomyces elasticus]
MAGTGEMPSFRNGVRESLGTASAQADESSTTPSDCTFPFMRLPPELRLNVYEFTEPAGMYLYPMWWPRQGPKRERQLHGAARYVQRLHAYLLPDHVTSNYSAERRAFRLLYDLTQRHPQHLRDLSTLQIISPLSALLHTNRLVRKEVLGVEFGQNTTVLDLQSSYKAYGLNLAWLRMTDPQSLDAIRKVLIIGQIQCFNETLRTSSPRQHGRKGLPFAIELDLLLTDGTVTIYMWSDTVRGTGEAESRLRGAVSIVEDFINHRNTAQHSSEERKVELIRMLKRVHARVGRPQLKLLSLRDQVCLVTFYAWAPMLLCQLLTTVMLLASLKSGDYDPTDLLAIFVGVMVIGVANFFMTDLTRASLLLWWSAAEAAGMVD